MSDRKESNETFKRVFSRTWSIDHLSDLIQRSFCILSDIEDNFKTLHLSFIAFFWLTCYIYHFRRKRVS